ncbi:hypothetical protein DLAC_04477 [Tieghemostelium lacteum]|uniref:Uncharacterized protein n=1 Tax=Tieghemostelium lacteum TaxID=361077 RepID=A0A151ZJU5_TIELA|nr:hypothetical protein DLAC_04477 [Tieghemostelium lacteum]|eukprot:KYQ94185.1 hypothetical protein DLAC_04477 [Tieghemostelium lacteum]
MPIIIVIHSLPLLNNYLIKYVLDNLLNQSTDLDYLIEFICKHTLISKKWSEEIIPKLWVFKPIRITNKTKQSSITKWLQLTHRYHIDYQVSTSGIELYQHEWVDKMKNRIVEIHYTNPILSREPISSFVNLRLLAINADLNFTLQQLPLLKLGLPNVTYQLSITHRNDMSSSDADQIFNSDSIFQMVSISSVYMQSIPNTSVLGSNRLTDLSLSSIIPANDLLLILSRSTNLERLNMVSVTMSPDPSLFDIVLETIEAHLMGTLKKLFIKTHYTTSFKSLISLYNAIKCEDADIDITSVLAYQSEKQTLKYVIDNRCIQSFHFKSPLNSFENTVMEDLNLLSGWKDKSQLKSITCSKAIDYSRYMKEMVSLTSLTVDQQAQTSSLSTEQKEQDCLNSVIQMNLPNLVTIGLSKSDRKTTKPILNIDTNILMLNNSLTCITLFYCNLSELIQLLACNHPTIKKLSIENLRYLSTMVSLVPSLRQNTTINCLEILSINSVGYVPHHLRISMNTFKIFVDSLCINRSLEKFTFPINHSALIDSLSQKELDKVLSNNSIIKTIKLILGSSNPPHGFDQIIQMFHKYSINFNLD